ncbi:MAG: hypothetical protein U0T84_01085 [Chitinophagales bacterium]
MIRLFAIAVMMALWADVRAQVIPVPKGYTLIDSVSGDLDKDGLWEMVALYNTRSDTFNIPRELIIYKPDTAGWKVWKRSNQVVMGSADGGTMGDAYNSMEINEQFLLITQSGGSNWKWGEVDKYKYIDSALYLVGYTATNGHPCDYWMEVNFNLLSGKLAVKKEFEDCEKDQAIYKRENESFIQKGIRITLEKRRSAEVQFFSPTYHHEITIARKEFTSP